MLRERGQCSASVSSSICTGAIYRRYSGRSYGLVAFQMVNFSTEYASLEDANFFNVALLDAGVPASLVREWRVAAPEDAV